MSHVPTAETEVEETVESKNDQAEQKDAAAEEKW
jgi:hypothetical protein